MAYRLRPLTERGLRYRLIHPRTILALLAVGILAGCAHTPATPAGTASVSQSSSFEAARARYRANDYSGALTLLQPLARKGDERAQYTLGYMYFYAEGVPQDRGRAMDLICSSALQGYPPARNALSELANRPPPVVDNPKPVSTPAPASQSSVPDASPTSSVPSSAAVRHTAAPRVRKTRVPPSLAPAHRARHRPEKRVRIAALHTPHPRPRTHAAIGGSHWLARRNPHHYTVQIAAVASDSLRSARWIARRSGLTDTAVVAIHRGHVRWNVVLWGDYSTLAAAHAAVASLPERLRTARPWIRRFRYVQALH